MPSFGAVMPYVIIWMIAAVVPIIDPNNGIRGQSNFSYGLHTKALSLKHFI
jgi:hypothetical protein